jgi:hypothetical protein
LAKYSSRNGSGHNVAHVSIGSRKSRNREREKLVRGLGVELAELHGCNLGLDDCWCDVFNEGTVANQDGESNCRLLFGEEVTLRDGLGLDQVGQVQNTTNLRRNGCHGSLRENNLNLTLPSATRLDREPSTLDFGVEQAILGVAALAAGVKATISIQLDIKLLHSFIAIVFETHIHVERIACRNKVREEHNLTTRAQRNRTCVNNFGNSSSASDLTRADKSTSGLVGSLDEEALQRRIVNNDIQELASFLIGSPRDVNIRCNEVTIAPVLGFPRGRHVERQAELERPSVGSGLQDEFVFRSTRVTMNSGDDVEVRVPALIDNSVAMLSVTVLLRPTNVAETVELDTYTANLTWAIDIKHNVSTYHLTWEVGGSFQDEAERWQTHRVSLLRKDFRSKHMKNVDFALPSQW